MVKLFTAVVTFKPSAHRQIIFHKI